MHVYERMENGKLRYRGFMGTVGVRGMFTGKLIGKGTAPHVGLFAAIPPWRIQK